MNETLKITGIEELQAGGAANAVVELPGFSEGCPFRARLRRPSLLVLMKSGQIPNTLLQPATKLFEDGIEGTVSEANLMQNPELMSQMLDVMQAVCKASFVEPTYAELEAANIELTDEQMMFVFGYSQRGVKQLESFRQQ